MKCMGLMSIASACLIASACGRVAPPPEEVIVYTSVDQDYSSNVFDAFTRETGVRVSPVYDTEAGKTTGLFRRLLAERDRPRADVFWNGEICRSIQLANEGITADLSDLLPDDDVRRWSDKNGRWAAFALRARVIVYNTNSVKPDQAPRTLADLTDKRWRAKVAIANPLFGTTATHMAALYEVLGDEKAEAWLLALKANDVRVVEGNSTVRDMVGAGEIPLGLTDTDDYFGGKLGGAPLGCVLPDQDGMGAFVIPSSVVMISGGPNPDAARRLVAFLLAARVEAIIANSRARHWPVRSGLKVPEDLERELKGLKPMDVDYRRVAARMAEVGRRVEKILLQ